MAIFVVIGFVIPIAEASQVKTFRLEIGQDYHLVANLRTGDKFSGSISINGGLDDDVAFWVTDPVGTTILDFGTVNHGCNFDFVAEVDGAHTVNFENTFIFLSPNFAKTVTVTYTIESESIFGLDPLILLFIILVIIIIGFAIYFVSRRNREKLQKPM